MYPHPRTYGCSLARAKPAIEGNPHHESWAAAPWTEAFVDIEGEDGPAPFYATRARMLWDDRALYIGAELEEPHLWATQQVRDSVIFHENDFEIFIDPDDDHHRYLEIEVNALATVWDLLLTKPYRDGGCAITAFDVADLEVAVALRGTLNDSTDLDQGWSLTMALPWRALSALSGRPAPPSVGDRWRVNFSRVQWDVEPHEGGYRKLEDHDEHNWVWTPQLAVDMHRPEMWGFLEFQVDPAPAGPDPYWQERCLLIDTYWEQKRHRERHGRYRATTDSEGVRLAAEADGWQAWTEAPDGAVLSIDAESRLSISSPARPR